MIEGEDKIGMLRKYHKSLANPAETLAIVVPDLLRTTRIESTVDLMPSAGHAFTFFAIIGMD